MTLSGKIRKKLPLICTVLLALFAFVGVCEGADLTDSTYSMGNYESFYTLQGDWLYATYLSNLIGFIIFRISGGRFLVFSIITRLIPAACAVFVLHGLKKQIPFPVLFLGEIFALGLCWCPTVILYHYLSYTAFTLAAVLLLTADDEKKKRYFFAGLILGMALLARISNLVYCALIFFVIYADAAEGKKNEILKDILKCVAGYISGVVLALLMLLISRLAAGESIAQSAGGIAEAFNWAAGLLSGDGESNGGYGMGDMIKLIADAYIFAAKRAVFMLLGLTAGTVMFMLKKDAFVKLKKILYMCGVALLFIYYYKRGVITVSYYNNGSIYGVCGIFILIMAIVFITVLLHKDIQLKEKRIACAALIVLLTAPLGTNNHFYALINQMFFMAPACVFLSIRLMRLYKGKAFAFPFTAMMISFFVLLLFQSVMFHFTYAFGDGEDGVKRVYRIENEGRLKGMKTNWKRGAAIDALMKAAEGTEGKLISYGNLPGLYYVLDKEPALSTLWPDLDSFSYEDMKADIDSFTATGEDAMLIIRSELADESDGKYRLIKEFIDEKGYVEGYNGDDYIMYLPGGVR